MFHVQYLHACHYGVRPRAGEPTWSCVEAIVAEGARAPTASRHIKYPATPTILYGISPIEVGQQALQLAAVARDAAGRRLRCDGALLMAGIACYPIAKECLTEPAERDAYRLWSFETCEWLGTSLGNHLRSVVEHSDESRMHLHFFALPSLGSDNRLDWHEWHPGRSMKHDAAEAGACKQDQDAAYRAGFVRWQDDYWWNVSRSYGFARVGAEKQKVSRLQKQMEKAVEVERAHMLDEIERDRAEMEHDARRRSFERYVAPYQNLQHRQVRLSAAYFAERKRRLAAEATIDALRTRLSAQDVPGSAPR